MNEQTSMKDDFGKALVDAPTYLLRYVGGLIIAILRDYSLITLLIFVVLLGLLLHSVLIPATAFFGLYFFLRVAVNITEGIMYHANQTAQSTMQHAGATAQLGMAVERLNPNQAQSAPEPPA